MKTQEAKDIREHAIDFERKLIADWLRYAVSKEIHALIQSGDYRYHFAHGTLPNINGEFFKPFETQVSCSTCKGTGIIYDAEFDKWFDCSDCHGIGKS